MKKNKKWLKRRIDTERDFLAKSFVEGAETPGESSFNDGKDRALASVSRLIDQLDEPEVLSQVLPAIPKFVAEYLCRAKADVTLMRVMELANTRNELPKWKKEYDWISANNETFARAWLDGYEVEEKKYYVVSTDNRMMLARMMGGTTITEAVPYKFENVYESVRESYQLTEQEIKDYDPRYWVFRKPVEETEE